MQDWAEQWKAKLHFLQSGFRVADSDMAVSFVHSLSESDYLRYFNYLLEGLGLGGEVASCSFPHPEEEEELWEGVKFSEDMTWNDPNDYAEQILSYDQFLDLMRLSAQWHLRQQPADETTLRAMFSGRNLAFGGEAPSVVDDGATWWRKCRAKYDLTMQLHRIADPMAVWSPVTDFFLYSFEQNYFDVLQQLFKRRPLVNTNMNVQFEFPSAQTVIIRETDDRAGWNLRSQPEIVELSSDKFEHLLELLAQGYAERRPQHKAKVAKLLKAK